MRLMKPIAAAILIAALDPFGKAGAQSLGDPHFQSQTLDVPPVIVGLNGFLNYSSGTATPTIIGAGFALNNVPTTPSSILSCSLMPALSGAVSSSAGSCATTIGGSVFTSGSVSAYSPTPNYAAQGIANTQFLGALGSVSSPTAATSAVMVLQKNSNLNTAGIDPTSYTSCRKTTTGASVSCTAGFFEGVDTAGGTTTFVEGLRTHGLVYGGTLGSSYGAILSGQSASPATTTSYIIGAEGEVLNNLSGDGNAPVFSSFNRDKFKASFVASCNGTYKCDVGFVTNPYNHVAARTGFLIGAGSVDDTGFAIGVGASMATGIDLTQGTYSSAPISIPNNAPLRIMNAAASSRLNTMFADTSNRLVLGTDEASIILATPVSAPALPTSAGSGGIYVCVDTSGNLYKKSACP